VILLFILRRLSARARIIVGAVSIVAGATTEIFVRFGIVLAVVGLIFVVSGIRAQRRGAVILASDSPDRVEVGVR